MSAPSAWTDERVQTLIRLWGRGLSASQIARALAGGVTRNAVIGKIHRLGLAGRAEPSPPNRARAEARRPRRPPRALVTPVARDAAAEAAFETAPATGTASVLSVRRGQCRWPIGDPLAEDFAFCGARAVRGAYCAPHAEIAYRPISQRPPRDHLLKLAGLS